MSNPKNKLNSISKCFELIRKDKLKRVSAILKTLNIISKC